jgi:hypothetical protein
MVPDAAGTCRYIIGDDAVVDGEVTSKIENAAAAYVG